MGQQVITSSGIIKGTATLTYATTLPSSPTDGIEAILVDSVSAPTYQWRFRYNAGSASSYKWEFVGGTSKAQSNTGSATAITSTTFVDLSTTLSFTLPNAGDWLLEWGGSLSTASAHRGHLGPYINATATDAIAGTNTGNGSTSSRYVTTGRAASDVIKLQGHTDNVSFGVTISSYYLYIRPVRVS